MLESIRTINDVKEQNMENRHTIKRKMKRYYKGKSPVYTLGLSQKSDFQPLTRKLDNGGHPIVETRQVWSLGWFQRWFLIL